MTAIVCAGCCQSINDASFIWNGAGMYHNHCVPRGNVTFSPAAPVLGSPIGWQWRRTGEPWPDKWLNFEPALTAPDTEKRAIYAGPVIAYGVKGSVKPGDCIHCGKEICNDLGWCNSFKAAPKDGVNPSHGGQQ